MPIKEAGVRTRGRVDFGVRTRSPDPGGVRARAQGHANFGARAQVFAPASFIGIRPALVFSLCPLMFCLYWHLASMCFKFYYRSFAKSM